MSTLNYLCTNDISDEDCNRCLVHGIKYRCPDGCPDFDDVRKHMSPEVLAERERFMTIMGIKDDERWGNADDE